MRKNEKIDNFYSKRLVITNLLIVVIIFFSLMMLVSRNELFLDETYISGSYSSYFFICLICLLLTYGVYFFLERKNKAFRKNYLIIAILCTLFITNLFVTLLTPTDDYWYVTSTSGIAYRVDFHIAPLERVYFILTCGAFLLMIYLLLVVIPQKFCFKKMINILMILACGVVFLYIIGSYFSDFNAYMSYFNGTFEIDNAPVGRFGHRNLFALVILFGMVAAIYLHLHYHKWYLWIPIAYFEFSLCILVAKTVMVTSFIILGGYFIYWLISTWVDHYKRNVIWIACLGVLLIGLCLFLSLPAFASNPIRIKLLNAINSLFVERGETTLNSRYHIWENAFSLLYNQYLYLGRGYGLYNLMLLASNRSDPLHGEEAFVSHNAYIEIMGRFGIIGLVFYLLFICYFIYCAIYLITKKRVGVGVFSLLTIVGFGVYGITESQILLDWTSTGIVLYGVALMPCLIYKEQIKHQEYQNEIKAKELSFAVETKQKPNISFDNCFRLFIFIFTFLYISFASLSFIFTDYLASGRILDFIILQILLLIFFLFIPRFIYLLHTINKERKDVHTTMIFSFVILFIPLIIIFLSRYFPLWGTLIFVVLSCLGLLAFLEMKLKDKTKLFSFYKATYQEYLIPACGGLIIGILIACFGSHIDSLSIFVSLLLILMIYSLLFTFVPLFSKKDNPIRKIALFAERKCVSFVSADLNKNLF